MLEGNSIPYIQFLESVPCYIACNIIIRNHLLRIPIILYFIKTVDSYIYTDYEIDIYFPYIGRVLVLYSTTRFQGFLRFSRIRVYIRNYRRHNFWGII
jgi:hypothetical protein